MNKRLWLGFVACLACLSTGVLPAQTMVGVRISANLSDGEFYVDGMKVIGSGSYTWAEGTKHMLEIRRLTQEDVNGTKRLRFLGFEDGQGLLLPGSNPVQQITASLKSPAYLVNFVREFRLDVWLNFDPLENVVQAARDANGCNFNNPYINRAGFVKPPESGFVCQDSSVTSGVRWVTEGTEVRVNAFAYPGYVFKGWDTSIGGIGDSHLATFTMKQPTMLRALFEMGRRHYLRSAPQQELKVLVDRTVVPTKTASGKCYAALDEPIHAVDPSNPAVPTSPGASTLPPYGPGQQISLCDGERDFLAGTKVLLAAPTSQTTNTNKLWIFDQWDLGDGTTGGQNTWWTVPDTWTPQTLTAKFVPGVHASFVTLPTGLKLKIDGRDNWPSLNFEWGIGHKHKVEAPLEQVDAKGRRYRFVSWSNGGEAAQEVTIVEDPVTPVSFRMVATFELLGQMTLSSEPSGVIATVSGTECKMPCTVDKPTGTELSVTVPGEVALSPDTRILFDGWGDGSKDLTRTIPFTGGAGTMVAKYRYLHKLRLISDPEGGVVWTFDPQPETGTYFPMGTRVEVTAKAQPGFKFRRWEGALSGPYNVGWLTMNVPQTVVTRLDRVPELKENAVTNAAGATPENVVAPGSLISIKGYNLAGQAQTGPKSPLAQTLQGVVVLLKNRLLPLVSVAPEEIIAQLPSDIVEGEYTLTVKTSDGSSVMAKCVVARNAPGLFKAAQATDELPFALAFHENGDAVTVESPAKAGETVVLMGTGFGPVDPQPLDGFAVPASPALPLQDALELEAAGQVRPAVWSGAAPLLVGYHLVKVQIDPTMGEAQNVQLKIRVNGRESNSVILPLQ